MTTRNKINEIFDLIEFMVLQLLLLALLILGGYTAIGTHLP
jgi:hypothetical protein